MKTIIPPINYDLAIDRITEFIRDKLSDANLPGVVIGMSGGLDSSVTTALAVRALGNDRVYGLILPDKRITPQEDVEDAIDLAKKLGIKYYVIEISKIYDAVINTIPFYDKDNYIANGNIKARIRMIILYYFANINKLMVCGTSDKSELLLGYYTKYGDGGSDILPIGDLYKTQVRILAKKLGLPEKIYSKPSSPRLWPGHMAEDELGLSYDVIDTILYLYFDSRKNVEQINEETGIPKDIISMIVNRVLKNEHKRMLPPIPKLGGISISSDWWMPFMPSIT